MPKLALAFGFVAMLATFALGASAQTVDRCYGCHSKLPPGRLRTPADQLAESVHRDPSISCPACHGGDRGDPTVRAHNSGDFNPRPPRAGVPDLCGGCHSDATFIRRFNATLSIDQRALYETSVHGKLFRQGDGQVAVCTACHGVHDVRAVTDPRSPVHPRNLARTCAGCHADAARMGRYGIASNQFDLWRESVHGKAVEAGSAGAPTCMSCHGSHGAVPPAIGSIGRVCGRCHREQLERFRESPHARAFERLGLPECEQCHGNHGVRHASADRIGLGPETICGRCHIEGQRAAATIDSIAKMVRSSHEAAQLARDGAGRSARAGFTSTEVSTALEELHTAEMKVGKVLHSFDGEKVRRATEEVRAAAQRATGALEHGSVLRRSQRHASQLLAVLLAAQLILMLIRMWKNPMPKGEVDT